MTGRVYDRTISQNVHFLDIFLQSNRIFKIPYAVDELLKPCHHEIDNLQLCFAFV